MRILVEMQIAGEMGGSTVSLPSAICKEIRADGPISLEIENPSRVYISNSSESPVNVQMVFETIEELQFKEVSK